MRPPRGDPNRRSRMRDFTCVAGKVADVLRHLRLDHPGRDGIHRNLARGELDRQGPGEGIDRTLARRVVGLTAPALVAQTDDTLMILPGAPDDHVRHSGVRDIEHAGDVGIEYGPDVLA